MSSDFLPLVYYGLICALLAGFTPRLFGLISRMIIGGVVGIIAAYSLPDALAWFDGLL